MYKEQRKMTFKSITSIILPVLLCVVLLPGCEGENHAAKTDAPVDTLQVLLLKAQQCSRLYTTEFHIHKIVTYDDIIQVKGKLFNQDYSFRLPIGDRKIAFPIDATLKGYIDMEELTAKNFIRDGERITIILPAPKVMLTASKIDQKNVKEYVSFSRAYFSDRELAEFERQGREAIIKSIPRYGIEKQAREGAARLLLPLITQMGFREENVTIVFPDHFTPASLEKQVELNTLEK